MSGGHFTTKLALKVPPKKGKKGGSRVIALEKGSFFTGFGTFGSKKAKNGKWRKVTSF